MAYSLAISMSESITAQFEVSLHGQIRDDLSPLGDVSDAQSCNLMGRKPSEIDMLEPYLPGHNGGKAGNGPQKSRFSGPIRPD